MHATYFSAFEDITPMWPVELFGYSGHREPFRSVQSPLEVNASVLRTRTHSLVTVTFDLLYVGARLRDALREITRAHGIPDSAVILVASHTHFAPATDCTKPLLGTVDERYLSWIIGRASALLIRVLLASPRPVQVEYTNVRCDANINRRRRWSWPTLSWRGLRVSGSIVVAPAHGVTRDTDLSVIRFKSTDGSVIGVWWKYACHPVGCPIATEVNAEFPGIVREQIRETLSHPGMPVMFLQGFAGDVRPFIRGAVGPRVSLRTIRAGPDFGRATVAQWKDWCNEIGFRVCGILLASNWQQVSGGISSDMVAIPLSELIAVPPQNSSPQSHLEIQRICLGNRLELIVGSAEFCSPWLRWGSACADTIHVGYSGDVFGYVPSEEQSTEGGYEAQGFLRFFGLTGRWRPGFERKLDELVSSMCLRHSNQSAIRKPSPQ